MRTNGVILNNTSILAGSISTPISVNPGFTGAIIFSSVSGNDPALTQLNVSLRLGGVNGSGYVIVHSSKPLTNQCLIGPLTLPAGEYVVVGIGGSTVVGAYVAMVPSF